MYVDVDVDVYLATTSSAYPRNQFSLSLSLVYIHGTSDNEHVCRFSDDICQGNICICTCSRFIGKYSVHKTKLHVCMYVHNLPTMLSLMVMSAAKYIGVRQAAPSPIKRFREIVGL